MITCDFHTHTCFSEDSSAAFDDCIEQALAQEIETIAVTDHFDPGYPNPNYSFSIDFERYLPALAKARGDFPGRIACGIELGIRDDELSELNNAAEAFDYDVIIGSCHSYKDMDISEYDFSDANLIRDGYAESRREFLEIFYENMYRCLNEFNNFDILGHMSVIDRYTGGLLDYEPYGDVIDEILKLLIDDGKALEINTSSFSYNMNTWLPRESILRRYRELGGELLTFGSDAHTPGLYRQHFNEASAFAESLGFRYYTVFKGRVPEERKL